jgi:limonene-1,2-epoxide hydrolase
MELSMTNSPKHARGPYALDAHAVHHMLAGFDKDVPSVEELRAFYTDDLVFQDPLQKITGLSPFREMNVRLLDKVQEMKIEMLESAQTGANIMFTFRMDLRPTKRAPMLRVEGMTHVRLDQHGKIELHRDYWDVASTLIELVPPLKRSYGWFTKKLA